MVYLKQNKFLYTSETLRNFARNSNYRDLENMKEYLEDFHRSNNIFEVDTFAGVYIDVEDRMKELQVMARNINMDTQLRKTRMESLLDIFKEEDEEEEL